MDKKLEELKGRVQPLEYQYKELGYYEGLSQKDKRHESSYETRVAIKHFCEQRFEPEMLTEYFEDIYWSPDDEVFEKREEFEIEFFNTMRIEIYGIPPKSREYNFPYPKTLSEFLFYCDKCQLGLEWRAK